MLKGISPLLSPDLLKTIAEMGHGDELVIGDCNFPAASMNDRCIRADGHKVTDLLDAILSLFPLDTFVECPVSFMQVVPGTMDEDPPVWEKYKEIIDKHDKNVKIEKIERFAFYERAKQAYATLATGETAFYACIILKKGTLI